MAYKADSAKDNQQDKADAWGNIVVVDSQGNEYNFSGGFNPIHQDKSKLHRSLYNKAVANGGEYVFTSKFVVRVPQADDGKDLDF